jgi:hypothetical protein
LYFNSLRDCPGRLPGAFFTPFVRISLNWFLNPWVYQSDDSGLFDLDYEVGSKPAADTAILTCCANFFWRAEGPIFNRPGRKAGNGVGQKTSAEGATQCELFSAAPSVLIAIHHLSRPDGRAY